MDTRGKTLVGMVHLPPLPGSPRGGTDLGPVIDRACREARLLERLGFDAALVENYGDSPFLAEQVPPETVASLAVVVREVVRGSSLAVGLNVLRNDARAALAIASVTGARFIRVNVHTGVVATDQGILTGQAAHTLRDRARLRSSVRIVADVHVKHGVPLDGTSLERAAREAAERGLADVLVVSGPQTGVATRPEDLERVKAAVPERPLWVGSGVDRGNAAELLAAADGLIVGTSLKRGGKTAAPLEARRVARFLASLGRR